MGTPFGFSVSTAGILGYPYGKRNEPWLLPHFVHRVNLRWITYQNVKDETIKLVKENRREGLHDVTVGKDFLKALTGKKKH